MNGRSAASAAAAALLLVLVAGCSGLASPSPTKPPEAEPSPTATSSPAPSRSSGPAQPSGDPDVILTTFLEAFAETDTPFHVDASVLLLGDARGRGALDLDVSGTDLAGRIEFTADGQRVEYEQIDVGGHTYIRHPGADWIVHPHTAPIQPLNPFRRLRQTDMTYTGLTRPPGRPWVYEFTTRKWIGEDPSSVATTVEDAAIEASALNVFVDQDGLPVNAFLTYGVTGTVDGEPVRFGYVVQYEFSDLGKPVTIEAPDVPE
jgi:hypothetical protein